jgi:hypothetical protein
LIYFACDAWLESHHWREGRKQTKLIFAEKLLAEEFSFTLLASCVYTFIRTTLLLPLLLFSLAKSVADQSFFKTPLFTMSFKDKNLSYTDIPARKERERRAQPHGVLSFLENFLA